MDELETLRSENKSLKELINNIDIEKTVIDQMYTAAVKEIFIQKKNSVSLEKIVNKLNDEKSFLESQLVKYTEWEESLNKSLKNE